MTILVVGSNTYKVSKDIKDKMIQIIQEKYSTPYTILAVEKDDFVEMRRDEYPSREKLQEELKYYEDKGWKVYISKGVK